MRGASMAANTAPTFSVGLGFVYTSFGGIDSAEDVLVQPDGRIVVAGETDFNTYALVRYNPDLSLDTTFSGDGFLSGDFGSGPSRGQGVLLQSDGRIVVAGLAAGDFGL